MKILATRSEMVTVEDRDIIEAAIKLVQRKARLSESRWVDGDGNIQQTHYTSHSWDSVERKATQEELDADKVIKHLRALQE